MEQTGFIIIYTPFANREKGKNNNNESELEEQIQQLQHVPNLELTSEVTTTKKEVEGRRFVEELMSYRRFILRPNLPAILLNQLKLLSVSVYYYCYYEKARLEKERVKWTSWSCDSEAQLDKLGVNVWSLEEGGNSKME
ncbi:hypothetical protein RCL_jg4777.t1 [Rhizophagus clarus]|uniref:Uncharacterized protein n=1 Tax=Rhizophagus clarus TaxID=94130 RepID=A0A8H3MLD5_9GLOM|nr:hypothetical protein RCL_jg4777.t1 [Rhizophagus clarus]